MRILIAEDEQDLNRILAERLKSEHYSVDSCYNGQDALDYLDSAEYDALILDIMMPVMGRPDGAEKTPQPGVLPCRCCFSPPKTVWTTGSGGWMPAPMTTW